MRQSTGFGCQGPFYFFFPIAKSHHLRKAQPMDCLLQFSVARIDLDLNVQTSAPTWKFCLFQFLYPTSGFAFSLKHCTATLQGCLSLQPHHQHIHTKAAPSAVVDRLLIPDLPPAAPGPACSLPGPLASPGKATFKFFQVLPLKPIVTCLVSFLCSNYTVFIP